MAVQIGNIRASGQVGSSGKRCRVDANWRHASFLLRVRSHTDSAMQPGKPPEQICWMLAVRRSPHFFPAPKDPSPRHLLRCLWRQAARTGSGHHVITATQCEPSTMGCRLSRQKQACADQPRVSPFDRAAKLAAIPAGASPANRRRSSHCCSYIQQRRGRLIR
jgi:hypothetical protein